MKRYLSIFIIFILLLTILYPEEGMFTLDNIPKKIKGIKLKPDEIFSPTGPCLADAVIIIGGGTGSFVSPDGLILTNHHVAYQAIQKNSSPENNYLRDGFYARSLEEEIPAPGYEAYITIDFKNITDTVKSVIKFEESLREKDMTPEEKAKAIEKKIAEIEKASENEEEGIIGQVISFLDGMEYYLYRYLKIKDIRLVYAPPSLIGVYGGDIDNWMWPRHTGDFSFLRAYVGPDGKPSEYSKENVPFKPEKYLIVSSKGIKKNDAVFILGYPGSTMRYRTSNSVDWNQNFSYPFRIRLFKDVIEILEDESKKGEDIAIKLSARIRGLNNALKNNQGMVDGFKKSKLLERKKMQEEEFKLWLKKNPDIIKEYGNPLDQIEKLYAELKKGAKRDNLIRYMIMIPTVRYATTIQKWSIEKEKPEGERKPQYMDFRIPRIKREFEIGAKDYYYPADKRLLGYFFERLLELPENEQPQFIKRLYTDKSKAKEQIKKFIDNVFKKTQITNPEMWIKMFNMNKAQLDSLNDPFIEFAKELNKEFDRIENKNYRFNGMITELRPKYYKLLKKWKGNEMYPDANRTIRFTYGYIKGYKPRDAVFYDYITSLSGIIEKHTGEEPFNAPDKLIKLWENKNYGIYMDKYINDIPVNFLATTDITGGNSGSPVLNGKGELVGLAFDGNYESMISDWQYDLNLTRTIAVDIRYVLYILEKYDSANRILEELNIK